MATIMDEKNDVGVLSRLQDKLAFVLSVFECVSIPLGLYLCFSSLLSEENFLVTHSVLCMKYLIVANFVAWSSVAGLTWTKNVAASTSKRVKIKYVYLFKCLVSMGLVTCCLHVFIVLFGAALTVDVSETFHLAALTASLSVWPCVLNYGLQWDNWVNSICVFEGSPLTGVDGCVSLGGKGALLGLWLGAIPIPLDWDRPWQQWPTTCVVGTLVGHMAGLACHVAATCYHMRKYTKRNKFV